MPLECVWTHGDPSLGNLAADLPDDLVADALARDRHSGARAIDAMSEGHRQFAAKQRLTEWAALHRRVHANGAREFLVACARCEDESARK